MSMDPDYDKNLESEIDRELKELGELQAPDSLMRRVFTVLEDRAELPWYRRRWLYWPLGWQCAAASLLLVLVVGLGIGSLLLLRTDSIANALQPIQVWLSGLSAAGHAIGVLANAGGLLFKQLGTGLIAACLVAAALLYAIGIGLGSLCFRLAAIRHERIQL